jgi:hypothetical protein
MVTEALLLAETFPAASLAQAKRIWVPEDEKVKEAGGVDVHTPAVGDGVAEDSLRV